MSCFICQLIVGIDVLDVQGNVLLCGIVDLCQLSLCEPYILICKAYIYIYLYLFFVVLVDDEMVVAVLFICHCFNHCKCRFKISALRVTQSSITACCLEQFLVIIHSTQCCINISFHITPIRSP